LGDWRRKEWMNGKLVFSEYRVAVCKKENLEMDDGGSECTTI
jgi:hypothetical protein